jgi:uncharacterized repeat protein (TIGR01451 family)
MMAGMALVSVSMGICARRKMYLVAACLLGGLLLAVFVGGLGGPARAAGVTVTAGALDVVINEVAWMGTLDSDTDEWIELYNNTDSSIDIASWSISGADTGVCLNFADADGALTTTIPAHGYLIYANTEDDARDSGGANIVDIWDATIGLNNNSPGQVILYDASDCAGNVIDTANQGTGDWFAGDNVDKKTMERKSPIGAGTDGANWCTNDGVTINGQDAGGNPINGTPKAQNSCYQPPAGDEADLVVVKTGPITADPGSVITYVIAVSNTGGAIATGALLTDTLPSAVDFVTQTGPFTFSQPGGMLSWEMGDVLTGAHHSITVTARVTDTAVGLLVNQVSVTTTASETVTANNVDSWATVVGESRVLISAVLYDGYQSGEPDEAVQLVNTGSVPVDLTGWELCKDTGSSLSCRALPSTVLSPSTRIWLARNAFSFTVSFGFSPDYELASWLSSGLSNTGDEVVLRDDGGAVVDALVYEGGKTSVEGWSGDAVQPYGNWGQDGQILYRIPDEVTGLPIVDTDTAADWVQYTGDPALGRRVLYPGWDFDPLFWPLAATEAATVVVGIAPDNAFDVVSQTIARAQRSISIEVYSLRHSEVVTALVQKAREGVSVTVLLEGQQAAMGHDDPQWQQELWACQEIESAGGQCWFMIHDTDARIFNRYDYIHAKFIIVDDEWVLIMSQNLTDSGLPSDDKSNGTYGSRGVVLATNAPAVVARASLVFALDLDPAHHNDLLRWSSALTGTYGPPVITYTPQLVVVDYMTTSVEFPSPLAVSGTVDFELFTAPEAALRQSDALLGLVSQAGEGDEVYVQQMYEYADWGDNPADDPNLRLEAYIDAARAGAKVRIMLNKGTFGGPNFGTPNTVTVAYVNQIARDEGLDLEVVLCDPTLYGIHNKMVLVWLHDKGGYVHIGSINGSEGSSKVNREMAIQLQSDEVYAYLKGMFDLDWRWSQPVYLPLVMRDYTPPADHLLISEVNYHGACEWVEIYNPTAVTITLTGYKIGDAQSAGRYEGMYIFPARQMAPGEVIVVAGDATACNLSFMTVDYEMYGSHPSVPNLAKDPNWGDGEFELGNSGDEVLLLDPANHPVDVVVYGTGRYPGVVPHPGVEWPDTLERIPANIDTDDCSHDFEPGGSPNWVQSYDTWCWSDPGGESVVGCSAPMSLASRSRWSNVSSSRSGTSSRMASRQEIR